MDSETFSVFHEHLESALYHTVLSLCQDHCPADAPRLSYLGVRELLGIYAKSRSGNKSLGPIRPKPLVRLGCIL